MADRKTPILLRRGPLSGEVMAIYRYTHKKLGDREVINATGKQSVQTDFDALLLEGLLDPDAQDIISILDGVADDKELNDEERSQVRAFRERLKETAERFNAWVDAQG